MRLVLVGPAYPLRGGIALHTAEMAGAARERGHAVSIVSYRRLYPGPLFPGRSQLDPGPPPAALAGIRADAIVDSLWPGSWWRAGKVVRDARPDLVVLQRWHPFFAPPLAAIAAAARRGGARVVWMVHNARPHEGRAGAWGPLLTLGYRAADIYLTHAASEAAALRALGVAGEVRTLRHPAPASLTDRADPDEARRALGIARAEVVFLFFGYVREYKGVDVLLDALARLSGEGPAWTALIAGEWYIPRGGADAAVARSPLAGRVRLLDRYVSNEELATLFAASTAVVLPYRAGTQSGVVPLSYAHGRGVVTTRVGGLAEAVVEGETGLLVPPEDAAALAAALEEIRAGKRFAPEAIAAAHAAGAWGPFVRALEDCAPRVR